MRRELYRTHADPKKKHRARLPRRKPPAPPAAPAPAPEHETFNISQEQKHGRGPRR